MFCVKKFVSAALLLTMVNTSSSFCLRIISGTYSQAGQTRPEMLDRFTTCNDDSNPFFFAGVYDGYSKVYAADYLSQRLHENIFSHELFETNTEQALTQSFLKTDREYNENDEAELECGAAVGTIIIKKETGMLYAANTGDVQIVLYKKKKCDNRITELSQIHIVANELGRLKQIVTNDNSYQLISTSPRQSKIHEDSSKNQLMNSRNPVARRLRSQDRSIKISPRQQDDIVRQLTASKIITESNVRSFYLDKQDPDPTKKCSYQIKLSRALCQRFFSPCVIPDPFVTSIQLTHDDEFVILASKTFWTVISSQVIPSLVNKYLKSAQRKLKTSSITEEVANRVAQYLVKKAFLVQDVGNQTVTIIFFDHENA